MSQAINEHKPFRVCWFTGLFYDILILEEAVGLSECHGGCGHACMRVCVCVRACGR